MSVVKQTQPRQFILIGLLAGSIATSLYGSLLNMAVPLFMKIFETTVTTTQWLVAGYILATGLISPSIGYLGDKFGYKKIYVLSLFSLLLTSIFCIFAWNIQALIIFRSLQGVAGGIILPVSLALIYQLLPKDQQAVSVSFWSVGNIAGGVLGPVLAGWLLNYASWQWLFFLNWPIVILAIFLSMKYIPKQSLAAHNNSLDIIGMSTISVCSLLILLAFSNGNAWGWSNPLTLSFIVLGLIGVLYFIHRCLKSKHPLLNFDVFRYRHFVFYLILDFICNNITFAFVFVAPLFFQNALGLSVLQTSLLCLPSALTMTVLMPFVGKMYNSLGPRRLIFTGAIIAMIATMPLLGLTTQTPIWLIVGCFMGRSVGLCLLTTPAINLGMSAVPPELSGHASAIANWLKQLSGSLIISLSSVLMIARMAAYQSQANAPMTPELSATLYAQGSKDVFFYMFLILLFALPIAYLIPKKEAYQAQERAKEENA